MLPDREAALRLHKKYGSNPVLLGHCEAVARGSEALARALKARGVAIDIDVVVAGALLHDIGRNRTMTVDHGHVGAALLLEEGVDARVVEIVRRHVGAGISDEEARALGFPRGDYIPRAVEERVVCFTDKMADAEKLRPFVEEEKRFIRRGHDVERLRRLKAGIAAELGGDPEKVVLSMAAAP